MCPLQARTQLKKSFPSASQSSLLVNWFKLYALSRFSYYPHSKPKPVITPPAPHTTTRHNTKQIPRGMWHIAHAQKAVPRVRGCANSTPTADEWLDGRVGRPGACGWKYGRPYGAAWGACVVLKTTTETAEDDQEGSRPSSVAVAIVHRFRGCGARPIW